MALEELLEVFLNKKNRDGILRRMFGGKGVFSRHFSSSKNTVLNGLDVITLQKNPNDQETQIFLFISKFE